LSINELTVAYFRLLRPKHWVKNLFLFIPLFFAGAFTNIDKILAVTWGFLAFCLVASSIYILNDYRDREDDKKHPRKKFRPIASGEVSPTMALIIAGALLVAGFTLAWFIRDKFMFVLGIYYLINVGYALGLKSVAILDIFLLAIGFVLRIKAGSVIAFIPLSEWIVIMVFLLSLFMAIGKRRDDVLIKMESGESMRKAVSGYNLEFLNVALSLITAVIIVAYLMYTMSDSVKERFGTYRLYYTSLFVIAGLMRYLQIIFVRQDSGSPTRILYKDRFLQLILFCWVASYFLIIYLKDVYIFKVTHAS